MFKKDRYKIIVLLKKPQFFFHTHTKSTPHSFDERITTASRCLQRQYAIRFPIHARALSIPVKLLQEKLNILPLPMHPRHLVVPPRLALLVYILEDIEAVQRRAERAPQIQLAGL